MKPCALESQYSNWFVLSSVGPSPSFSAWLTMAKIYLTEIHINKNKQPQTIQIDVAKNVTKTGSEP